MSKTITSNTVPNLYESMITVAHTPRDLWESVVGDAACEISVTLGDDFNEFGVIVRKKGFSFML